MKNRELNIFNLSFLDIMACGFAAVVMLILISRPDTEPQAIQAPPARPLPDSTQSATLNEQLAVLSERLQRLRTRRELVARDAASLHRTLATLGQELTDKEQRDADLKQSLEGLALAKETLEQAGTSRGKRSIPRDQEVAGIPVDSDYVVFVVDTSGSMRQIWDRVAREIIHVLEIHPRVSGFQILSDLGKSMVSGYEGRWIPDSPGRRKSITQVFGSWADASNSSPVEGVEQALKRYAKPGIKTSIYVFGDDYTGGSYDAVVDQLTRMNFSTDGKQLARIHAVGFISPNTTNRFSILMRELSRRNDGTFLALPQ